MIKFIFPLFFILCVYEVKSQCNQDLVIAEVLTDPNGNVNNFDTDGDGTAGNLDELVKICNTGTMPIGLEGYTLNDPSVGDWFTFPAGSMVAPGACVTVVTNFSGTLPPGVFSPMRGSAVINNVGDTVTLLEPMGTVCTSFQAVAGTDGCVQSADIVELVCDADGYSFTTSVVITPITLSTFTVELINDNAVLKWTTLSEENNDVIEIQRSFNGLAWEKIGDIDGQGTTFDQTDYVFEDKNIINGTTFYRLNQIDFDGTSSLSDIVSITTNSLNELEIGAVNKQSINITSSLEGDASYRLYNSMGELVANGEFYAIRGNQSIFYRSGEIASGFYIVQIDVDGQSMTRKFVVN